MMKKLMMMSLLGMVCAAGMAQTAASAVDGKKETLFSSENHEGTPYRIPAIATLNNGSVLVLSDQRPCGADVGNGEVDIYAKVGTIAADGTYNWTPSTSDPSVEGGLKIADGTDGTNGTVENGYGDAAVVVDRESGKVLVICVSGNVVFGSGTSSSHNKMARIIGSADGLSWQNPEDVTKAFFDNLLPSAYTMFMTSGRMVQSQRVKVGDYYRIYGALLVKESSGKNNYVVYSDDFGTSWSLLKDNEDNSVAISGGDEAKVEELPNGDIVISSRTAGGRIFNVFNFTNIEEDEDEGEWKTQSSYTFAGSNETNGEFILYKELVKDGTEYNVILQSLPTGDKTNGFFGLGAKTGREKVSVYYKAFATDKSSWAVSDFTSGWTKGIEVDNGASAYSTMTILPNGQIGFLYEDDYNTTASGHGANIVYVPLTAEEITGGAYTANPETNINLKPHKAMSQVSCDECKSSSYSTMYLPFGVQLPERVTAYTGTLEGNVLTIKAIESGVVPAYTAVLLEDKQNRPNIELTIVNTTAKIENNALQGTLTAIDGIDQSKYYVLGHDSSHIGFYHPNSNTLKANAAYIYIEDGAAALSIRREGATDIEEEEVAIDNEQSAIIYDLMGRRVENPTRGLYIINGKKVFVK